MKDEHFETLNNSVVIKRLGGEYPNNYLLLLMKVNNYFKGKVITLGWFCAWEIKTYEVVVGDEYIFSITELGEIECIWNGGVGRGIEIEVAIKNAVEASNHNCLSMIN